MSGSNDWIETANGGAALVREFGIERRVLGASASELRQLASEAEGEPETIEGYAALFDSESEDLGGFIELIAPGAFSKTLAEADVRALQNHDPNRILGRTKPGTLELREDDRGLRFRVQVPGVSWARDLVVSMLRGDVDQTSFGFEAIRDRWETIGGVVRRTLLEVRLFDVSVVTFPAYPETLAEVRARALEAGSEPGRAAHSDLSEGESDRRGRRSIAAARLALRRRRAGLD